MPDTGSSQETQKVVIDRLSIKLSGLSEADGRRLAQLVASELGRLSNSFSVPGRIDSLKISLPSKESEDTNMLASRISAQIIEELKRNS